MRRDFKNLERNFRKMLHRVAGKNEKDLEFNLLHNLGVIYRDRLAQPEEQWRPFVAPAGLLGRIYRLTTSYRRAPA